MIDLYFLAHFTECDTRKVRRPLLFRGGFTVLILLLSGVCISCFSQPVSQTLEELHRQKKAAQMEKDTLALAWSHYWIAKLKMPEETRQDSIYYYLIEGKKLAEQRDDSLVYELNNNLIYWNTHQGNFAEIYPLLAENERYARSLGNDFLLMRAYFSYADFYDPARYNLPDSCIYYANSALEIAQSLLDTVHIAIAKNRLATAFIEIDSLQDLAYQYSEEVIALSDHVGWLDFLKAPSYIFIGQYYYQKGQYAQSVEQLEAAVAVAQKNNSTGYLQMAYQHLASCLEKMGRFREALAAHREERAYYESIYNQRSEEQIAQLKVAFDTELKELELQRLQREKEIQAGRIDRQQSLFAGIGLFGLLFSLVLGSAIINYRKRLEINNALLAAQEELATARTQFFTNISHEFRTPLTVISGIAQRIQDPEQKELILRNSKNLLDLVGQVLDLHKLESGRLTPDWQYADVIPFLTYLSESFQSLAQNKNIRISFQSEPAELPMDYDADKLRVIVGNLLSNAIKFTKSGGNVDVMVSRREEQLVLVVRDTGPGIQKEDLPRVFERFYQGKNGSGIGGTGIGLSLVRDLVELMNGKVHVESKEGKGAAFTVSLPITCKAASAEQSYEKGTDPSVSAVTEEAPAGIKEWSPVAERNTILIIEDSPDVIRYIRTCLEPAYLLECASNGEAGLRKALEIIPDLILTDVMMPEKNGYEVCQALKSHPYTSHIPVIMLTAKATQQEKLAGFMHGADAYLIKPFDEEELQVRISNLLEDRRRWQEKFQQGGFSFPARELTPEEQFLQEARAVLLRRLDDPDYTVELFCRDLGMSRTQLHRKMKALSGYATTRFMNDIRLTEARALLEKGKMNVSEVAFAVGFQYPNYFSKLFMEKFGFAPSEGLK